jgi:sRNA-binding protein
MLLPMEPRSVDCAKGPAQHSHDQQPLSELKADVARQKQRETKKFSKAVQAERTKEKAQQKKANISDITRLRKQRQKSVSLQLKHVSVPIIMLSVCNGNTGLPFCCLPIALL